MTSRTLIVSLVLSFIFSSMMVCSAAWSGAGRDIRVVCDKWPDSSSIEAFARDAIRLMGAQTNEDRALAVFRFIRMWTTATDGHVPREPALGDTYIDDPLKVLNVYGAHHCDGLTRVMEWAWRSLGYRAEKLYRSGHTQADVFYRDLDGIMRGHLFDLSQGWFVYDRSGTHIAGPDEIASDFSLIFWPSRGPKPAHPHYWGMWNWVHAPNIEQPDYSPELRLRIGEKITWYWDNLDKPYQDNFRKKGSKDFEHGPYPVTYGNGVLSYAPLGQGKKAAREASEDAINIELRAGPEGSLTLTPMISGKPGELVYRIDSPYVISGVELSADMFRASRADRLAILLSVDDGSTWHKAWSARETGRIELKGLDICRELDIYAQNPQMDGTPFGRYSYLLKFVMSAKDKTDAVRLHDFHIQTVFQHNIFALPQLWPGTNTLRVKADLEPGIALLVRPAWDDHSGKGRLSRVRVGKPPFEYFVTTAGRTWSDVRCRSLSIEAVPGKAENRVLAQEGPAKVLREQGPKDAFPTQALVGRQKPGSLKSIEAYVQDLNDPGKQVDALAGLMVLKDKSSFDAVKQVALDSIRFPQKDMAVQALQLIDPGKAAPVLLDIIEKDPKVSLKKDPNNKYVQLGHWYNLSALAGHILAGAGERAAVEPLVTVLESIIRQDDTWWEPHGSIIRSLGRLGDPRAAPAIRPFLSRNADEAARAVEALGRLGDRESIPRIRKLSETTDYPVLKEKAVEALERMEESLQ